MSIKNLFTAMKMEVGSSITKFVLVKLADNSNDSGECWPSYDCIAKECEISRRSAINHVKKLIEMGLVKKTIRSGKNGNSSNIYHLVLDGELSAPPSESNTPPSEQSAPGGERDAPAPSESPAPESVRSFESVNEPKSMSESGDSNPVTPIKKSQTPYKKIHQLYQTYLVETGEGGDRLVDVQVLDKERTARMKSFWMLMDRNLEKVEKYFKWIWDYRESHIWLFGKNNRGWVADIEFLCRDKTVRKARENQLGNWSDAA